MFNKKIYLYMLILLMMSICAVSAISAADNATDSVAIDDACNGDIITDFDEDLSKATADNSVAIDENKEILASGGEQTLSQDQSSEVHSGLPVSSYQYQVIIQDGNQIQATKSGKINYYLKPYNMFYMDNFNFKFVVFDSTSMVYQTGYYADDQMSFSEGMYYATFPANSLKPGMYLIGAINKADNAVMSANYLKVSGTAVITANDFNGVYNTGTMTARATDSKGNPLTAMNIQVVFTSGNTKITKNYNTDSNGYVSFTPPVGVGTWTVTFSSGYSFVSAKAVTKKATINKAPLKVEVYKTTGYNGYKTTIKAKVTSNGKNVNEGTVTFKVNGKTYTAPVKNGVATINVKLSKVKKYKYSAAFSGGNYQTPAAVKSQVVVKKTLKTKISFKNCKVYVFDKKVVKFKVKTKSGKKVKSGTLKIVGAGQTQYVKVKNGKAKMMAQGLHAMKHFKGFTKKGETYKKYIKQKFKVKLIPSSHKYKSSSKKIKITSVFKCPGCGKTSSHYHRARDSDYRYYKHFIAVV